MTKFFKTEKPIYSGDFKDNPHYLEMSVKFHKGKGYEIVVEPVNRQPMNESNPNGNFIISKVFDKEYYDFYNDLCLLVYPTSRRTQKGENYATEFMSKHESAILARYIELAVERGGKPITLTGETFETI